MFSFKAILLLQTLLVVGIVSVSSFKYKKLDCSAVENVVPLERYKDLCITVHDLGAADGEKKFTFSPANRLDIVEMCTCNLLRHQLVWESMVTHEVDTLFLAIKKLIETKIGEKKDAVVPKDNIMFQEDQLGEEMYLWDSFNKILSSADIKVDGPDYSDELIGFFTDIYYQPESFMMPFKVEKVRISGLLRFLSGICGQLRDKFDVYFTYFKNLKELSGNPRFLFRIASYDENLYKLLSVRNMCEFMSFAGTLI